MGMSTHVVGFKPPDEKWKKMKAILDSCQNAGIRVPDEVNEFFDYRPPDEKGVEVEITPTEWQDDSSEGCDIYVDDIPKDVKIIRFYNSF